MALELARRRERRQLSLLFIRPFLPLLRVVGPKPLRGFGSLVVGVNDLGVERAVGTRVVGVVAARALGGQHVCN